MKIRMVVKEVGKQPKIVEKENTLETYQGLVDGLIEVVHRPFLPGDAIAIVDEEGLLKNRPMNILLPDGTLLAGTTVFVAVNGENFAGLTEETAEELMRALTRKE